MEAGTQNVVYQKWPDNIFPMANSIAFGKAPRREADSQPISQSVRQAVSRASRQADKQAEMHSLAFFIGGLQLQTRRNSTGALQEQSAVKW